MSKIHHHHIPGYNSFLVCVEEDSGQDCLCPYQMELVPDNNRYPSALYIDEDKCHEDLDEDSNLYKRSCRIASLTSEDVAPDVGIIKEEAL